MDYLTKEDWNCFLLPKICDDKSFSEHLKENIKIQNSFIRLINNIINSQKNSEKKLFQRILISSMIYYYKYILFNNISHSDLSSLDKLVLFCSSIFLSFKEANKLIHINILSTKFQPFFKKFKIFEIEEIRNLVIQKEFDILMSIEFNINIDSPYGLLNYIKLYLTKLQKGNEAIVRIINYINLNLNDSILFPLCLYYTPKEILFSCILLVKKEYKLDFININDLIKLTKCQIEIDNINKCALYISKIKKCKNDLIEKNLNAKKDNIRNNGNNDNINIKNISLIQNNIN
jgi:hypothetical protein